MVMDRDDMTEKLGDLLHLDVDAVRAYDQAIEKVEDTSDREQLTGFKRDHERHVTDLTRMIKDLGGEPPEPNPDFKGMLIEGTTALRSATGTEGALKAMRMNEHVTTSQYKDSLEWDVTQDVGLLLEDNYRDEQRHLSWIEERLSVATGAGRKDY